LFVCCWLLAVVACRPVAKMVKKKIERKMLNKYFMTSKFKRLNVNHCCCCCYRCCCCCCCCCCCYCCCLLFAVVVIIIIFVAGKLPTKPTAANYFVSNNNSNNIRYTFAGSALSYQLPLPLSKFCSCFSFCWS